ncbi:hypothetical protein [Massilia sp. H6]|uniref:hypothetical protein n=1 Tax=Massilia sp. H6 TaxID=2970464 RepID=UPI0021691CD5|nr:hypothetical protein [Massilia sp. H6]UVW28757.1 hypothetical protein NRS07_00975 [Massilia sp. H6]
MHDKYLPALLLAACLDVSSPALAELVDRINTQRVKALARAARRQLERPST